MRRARHACANPGRGALTLTAADLRARAQVRVSVRLPLGCREDLVAAVQALGSPRVLNAERASLARAILAYLEDHQYAVASLIQQAQEAGAEQRIAARFSRALA